MLQRYLSRISKNASYFFSGTLLTITLFCPAISTADSYLDSIEAEADKTTVLQKAHKEQEKLKRITSSNPTKKTNTAPAQNKVVAKDISEESTNEFETGLYQEFPGNYAVYSRLSDEDKREVIATYKNAGNVKGLVRYSSSLTLILKLASK